MKCFVHCCVSVRVLSQFVFSRIVFIPIFFNLIFVDCIFAENLRAENLRQVTEIVVTPNRFAVPKEQSGSSVSVITQEQIVANGSESVFDVLRQVSGLEVVQNGGQGTTATVFLRGADSDQTLVLIDGVRMNSPAGGLFDFSDLRPENIERIEVLRGAQSVVYGSEAIGGVINIISKKGVAGRSLSFTTEGGSFGTSRQVLNFNAGTKDTKLSTTASFLDSDGISVAAQRNGNSEKDSYLNADFSSRADVDFSDSSKAQAVFRYMRGEVELDGFDFLTGGVDDLNFSQNRDVYLASTKIEKSITSSLDANIQLGYTEEDLTGLDEDTEFNNYDISTNSFNISPQANLRLSENQDVVLGYQIETREGKNKGNFDQKRDINSIFADYLVGIQNKLFITLGARYENDSDYGSQTSYRVTAATPLEFLNARLHGSLGTGFKAPTFNELYFPNFGNPNLSPEESIGYDVGVEKVFLSGDLKTDVTFFHNKFDDLIAFDTTSFVAENIEEARALGVETSVDYYYKKLASLGLAYTYTASEDKNTGAVLPRRPRHKTSANLSFTPCDKLQLSSAIILVNSRRESTGEKMDNYVKVDARASYLLSPNLKPFVRIENAFDEDYEETIGFGTQGFSAFGGVELRS
jgi:vitamin B12 transporter